MLQAAVGGRDPAVGEQAAPAAVGRLLRLCLCAGYRWVMVVSLQANTEALTAQGEPYGMRSLCKDSVTPLKPRSPAHRRAVSRIKIHRSTPIPQLPPLAAVRQGGAAML